MSAAPQFGVMFFASHENALAGDKYRLILETARFADRHGFSTLWAPERHYTKFGCLFPNPAVLHAALATTTERLRLNAGSVVLPLRDPIHVAEEWAMVDNLSRGRVGVSFASGWNPADFVTRPENYADRHELLFAGIETVRRLWEGGTVQAVDGMGQAAEVSIYPTPVQPKLPVWVTAAGNPRTYERAGEIGANLLTHVLDHGVDKLGELIAVYRRSRRRAGHDPAAGVVSVMLHTFIGESASQVRELVRAPFCEYLKSNIGLLGGLAQSRGQNFDVASLSAADLDAFVGLLFERFYGSRALFGTPESCVGLVRELGAIGVDEIACLLDFGPSPDVILDHLPYLDRLRQLAVAEAAPVHVEEPTIAAIQSRCTECITGEEFYERLEDRGVQLGEAFGCVESIWRRDGEALAEVRRPESVDGEGYLLHPAFLDCLFQTVAMAAPSGQFDRGDLYLPSGMESFEVFADPGERAWSHVILQSSDENTLVGDITIRDASGERIACAEGLRLARSHFANDIAPDLMYRVEWIAKPAAGVKDAAGPWLVVPDESRVGERLASLLIARGERCVVASPAEVELSGWRGVVHLGSWEQLLPLARGASQARLWIATRDAAVSPDAAMLWGIGRTWAAEFPERWGGLVDLDPSAAAEICAEQLLAEILSSDGEDQLRYRDSVRYAARLVRTPPVRKRKLRLRSDAAYLVTGGRQGFGLAAATRLAERGAGHLILLGRKQPPVTFPALEALGARMTYAAVDASDPRALSEFLAAWQGPPIRGVIHAASKWRSDSGETYVRPLAELDTAAFHAVLGPKSRGAQALHEALASLPLDFFVMFSSAASLVGSSGQANYAAASAYLDALAHHRRAAGLPALSIDWGPISEAGFGATAEGLRLHQLWESLGIHRTGPEEALDAMESLMQSGATQAAVTRIDWDAVARSFPSFAKLPYLEQLIASATPAARTDLAERLHAAPEREGRELLLHHIRDQVSAVMQWAPGEHPDLDQGLFDAGMDSLMALELKNRLQAALGCDIPATVAFDHPTIRAIAAHLYRKIVPAAAPVEAAVPASDIDELLGRIEGFSDSEASRLLAARGFTA